jgi:hypothetical protein
MDVISDIECRKYIESLDKVKAHIFLEYDGKGISHSQLTHMACNITCAHILSKAISKLKK